MPWRAELGDLGSGTSRRARMPGVDRVVEGLDLAADRRRSPCGQVRDRRDLDAFAGEVHRACRRSRRSRPRARSRSRAKAAMPSRFATDSRARTRAFLRIAERQAVLGRVSGRRSPDRSRRRHRIRPSIPPDMAYSAAPVTSTSHHRGPLRDARPLGIPVPVVQSARTSRTCFHPTWIARARPAGRPDRPLQRRGRRALHTPPALPRACGVAVVDRADHVQPASSSSRSSCSTSSCPRDRDHRHRRRWSGSASCRFPPILAAHERELARERYFTKQKLRRPGADDPQARGGPSAQRRRR